MDVPRLLEPAGEAGLSYLELAEKLDPTVDGPVEFTSGEAGTVYLCHPFLIHASQPNYSSRPRFLAQPPLYPAQPFQLHRDADDYSPVEIAIRLGLGV